MLYKPRKTNYIAAMKVEDPDVSTFGIVSAKGKVQGSCNCGKPLDDHWILNGQIICPESYIIYEGAAITGVVSKKNFEEMYVPLCEE